MNKEFEKLKAQFGTTHLQTKSNKNDFKISHIETDLKDFAGKTAFSFDLGLLELSDTKLGPHGHTAATYILEWNSKSYPHKLSVTNKLALKSKDLQNCPDYLQNFILENMEVFVSKLQEFLQIDKEKILNTLYDEEEKRARLDKDEM